jgi:hypothetical protein
MTGMSHHACLYTLLDEEFIFICFTVAVEEEEFQTATYGMYENGGFMTHFSLTEMLPLIHRTKQ